MMITRIISPILRFGEFVCATIVLGLIGYFLHERNETGFGPKGREIYTIVIAALSTLLSILWMVPLTTRLLLYPIDFILSFAWFSSFGALNNYTSDLGCGGWMDWTGITRGDQCGKWKATQAFSFIGACFWLASAILGIFMFHKRRSGTDATNGTTKTGGRRGLFGRRSQV
ncbi:integral membrane protein [Eremomyces bilateralis CBS 781.70]|uniref:Integral membrane protein n=1 Tax=Eremomyces bilateralis CBS 781.70 TaxID=1392243 RepID=A0A6G1GAJ7_9PEZI|nr:uncharacterized protein P152DRAFT_455973 [Eremomyces bilateralis CBS 781.70]KAF1814931.1 integral membrane protein [Eremomyces bilateralis CBS 781.70]